MLKRKIETKILDWYNHDNNALLVDGARQVGKTTSILNVFKMHNIDYVHFNLYADVKFAKFLQKAESLTVDDFLSGLSIHTKHELKKNETVIFIDEVQVCKELLTKIKFLVEEASYRYIFSGSILGITLTNLRSAPVGFLDIINMYPLDFEEFLWSQGIKTETISLLRDYYIKKKPVLSTIHNKIMDLFYKYLIVGGMPEAVQSFCDNNNYNEVHKIHKQIIKMYENDITKYQNNNKKLKLISTFNLVPAELNKQNKRYTLKNLNNFYKYDRYEATFEWLNIAELTIPVYNVLSPEIPLLLNEKATLFKLFLNDVGLLTSMYGVSTIRKILNAESNINNGALYENFVAQELHAHAYKIYYYKNKKFGEIDFVIEEDSKPLLIEVKSGKSLRHCALNNLMSNKAYNISSAYMFSNKNVSQENVATVDMQNKNFLVNERYSLTYLPIYMVMFIDSNELI